MQLLNSDSSTIAKHSQVALINNAGASMFKDAKVYLNDVCINQRSDNYHYRKYIETLTSFDDSLKTSYCTARGYFEDTEGRVSPPCKL